VLQPILDPTFSEHSYGFRPGRRAQDAVLAAQKYVQSGLRVVVNVDLSRFFDRINQRLNRKPVYTESSTPHSASTEASCFKSSEMMKLDGASRHTANSTTGILKC
jgi:hypothetical protein